MLVWKHTTFHFHARLEANDVSFSCSFGSMRRFIYMLVWEHTTFHLHARLGAYDVSFTCSFGGIRRFIYMLVWRAHDAFTCLFEEHKSFQRLLIALVARAIFTWRVTCSLFWSVRRLLIALLAKAISPTWHNDPVSSVFVNHVRLWLWFTRARWRTVYSLKSIRTYWSRLHLENLRTTGGEEVF